MWIGKVKKQTFGIHVTETTYNCKYVETLLFEKKINKIYENMKFLFIRIRNFVVHSLQFSVLVYSLQTLTQFFKEAL
jgi:hypothetical protein